MRAIIMTRAVITFNWTDTGCTAIPWLTKLQARKPKVSLCSSARGLSNFRTIIGWSGWARALGGFRSQDWLHEDVSEHIRSFNVAGLTVVGQVGSAELNAMFLLGSILAFPRTRARGSSARIEDTRSLASILA
jgi:hypothetical protein